MSNGQHITLAGAYHIAENCDVEDVTVHGDDLRAVTRLVTGGSHNIAYVMNRTTGKPVLACPHRHQSHVTAQRCADLMLKTGKITQKRYSNEHSDT